MPTFQALRPFTFLPLLFCFACGGDTSSSSVAAGESAPQQEAAPGHLTMTIDGKEWTTEGDVDDDSLTLGKNQLHMTLKARLSGGSGALAPEMRLTISKETLDAGTFPITRSRYSEAYTSGQSAAVNVNSEERFPHMEGSEGTITFSALETTEEGFANYGILRAAGSLEGTFRDADGNSFKVAGSFEYVR